MLSKAVGGSKFPVSLVEILVGPNSVASTLCPSSQCLEGNQRMPHETFQLADSYPEVLKRVEEEAIFYSRHRYQQMEVHQVQPGDGETYSVLYLASGNVQAFCQVGWNVAGLCCCWSKPTDSYPTFKAKRVILERVCGSVELPGFWITDFWEM